MKLILIALTLAAAMTAQEKPKTVCGMKLKGQNELSRHTELIEVACPDWPKLAAIAGLPIPANTKPQTQVLVHARAGESFVVTLDGHKVAGVLYDGGWMAPGLKVGMVVFEGDQFQDIKVSIQGELP